jgi:hypothetical protein
MVLYYQVMSSQGFFNRAFFKPAGLEELGTTEFRGGKGDYVTRKIFPLLKGAQNYGCTKVHKYQVILRLAIIDSNKNVLRFNI